MEATVKGCRNQHQGMNWCRKSTRYSIYCRDGMACVWCGKGIERATLTLDHIIPSSKPGSTNASTNLVTACMECNRLRGARSIKEFAADIAGFRRERTAGQIVAFVLECAARPLDRAKGRELLAARTAKKGE